MVPPRGPKRSHRADTHRSLGDLLRPLVAGQRHLPDFLRARLRRPFSPYKREAVGSTPTAPTRSEHMWIFKKIDCGLKMVPLVQPEVWIPGVPAARGTSFEHRNGHECTDPRFHRQWVGRWRGSVNLGFDAHGKRIRRRVTGPTKTAAWRPGPSCASSWAARHGPRQRQPVPQRRHRAPRQVTAALPGHGRDPGQRQLDLAP